MPDIAMCQNNTCKLCKVCYRYMATPLDQWRQQYADFKPGEDGVCEDWIPMSREKQE